MHNSLPLKPRRRRHWLPPLKFRARPFREFSRSLDEALAKLEGRYPDRRPHLPLSRMSGRISS